MDTSETYIKMCDCGEIQGQWENEFGDYIIFREHFQRYGDEDVERVDEYLPPKIQKNYIWLPCQDQIQEMMGDMKGINILVNQFYIFCLQGEYKAYHLAAACFDSMEQLWLAFYMAEKHSRVWDGKKWIKNA